MTNCPGYVNVKVDIWPASPEYKPLVNCDLLVSCPPTFSLSFSLPRRRVADVARSDCVLQCVFDDAKDVRRLLLRPPPFDRRRSSADSPPRRRTTDLDETVERSYNDDDDDDDDRILGVDRPTFGVAVLLTTSVALTLVSLFRDVFRVTTVGRRGRRAAAAAFTPANYESSARTAQLSQLSFSSALPPSSSSSSSVQPRRQPSVAARRTCVSAFILARLIYTFVFTFSVFTTLVGVALRQQLDSAVVATTPTPKSRPTANVEEDPAASTSSRLQVTHCLAGSTIRLTGTGNASARRFAAAADVVASSIVSARTATARWAQQTVDRFIDGVRVGLTRQGRYGQTASTNHWLLFPRALYNRTTVRRLNRTSPANDANLTTTDTFWNFLHVTPLEVDLSLWTANIRLR